MTVTKIMIIVCFVLFFWILFLMNAHAKSYASVDDALADGVVVTCQRPLTWQKDGSEIKFKDNPDKRVYAWPDCGSDMEAQ